MFKSTLRAAPRRITTSRTIFPNTSSSRRLLSTAPPSQKSRSWKSSAARWAVAAGAVYYYNTSNLFAEEPEAAIQRLDTSIHHTQESSQPTVDAIVEEKRAREAQRVTEEERQRQNAEKAITHDTPLPNEEEESEGGLEGLEDEAGQQGAFNPETGEINWDCPCLGGMADGPCGEEFKAAFSCFVHSTEEPKGVECIEKFKGMQDCFRAHPEMYGEELEDDEEEVEEELRAREEAKGELPGASAKSIGEPASKTAQKSASVGSEVTKESETAEPFRNTSTTTSLDTKESVAEDKLVPKAAHDACP